MEKYEYFENVEKNALFTDVQCQFCGSNHYCLDGLYFKRNDIISICLNCFDKKIINVEIPDYIKARIKSDADIKFKSLQFNPPVPWTHSNDWAVCCDDYMIYVGNWKQEDFNNHSETGNGKELLEKLMNPEVLNKVGNINTLWEHIGTEMLAFVFKCSHCEKYIIICQ